MPSWQSHILRLAQHGFRFFSGKFNGLDVAKERRDSQIAEKLFKPSSAVQYAVITANGVPAEWITPIGLSTEQVVLYVHGGFLGGPLANGLSVPDFNWLLSDLILGEWHLELLRRKENHLLFLVTRARDEAQKVGRMLQP